MKINTTIKPKSDLFWNLASNIASLLSITLITYKLLNKLSISWFLIAIIIVFINSIIWLIFYMISNAILNQAMKNPDKFKDSKFFIIETTIVDDEDKPIISDNTETENNLFSIDLKEGNNNEK